MSLLARNLTNAPITLVVGTSPAIPASLVSGVRGQPVDVSLELRPDFAIDPTLGKTGGLDAADFILLQAQVCSF
jgi:hypothetical protein